MAEKTWATVTEKGEGVEDGEFYPKEFTSGDIIYGGLASRAINHGWAEQGEGDPPVKPQPGAPDPVMSANVEELGKRVALATKDKSKLVADLAERDEVIVGLTAQVGENKQDILKITDLTAQLKAADDALKTVTHESAQEKAFSSALIDLVQGAGVMNDELAAVLQDFNRSDELDLTPKDMASKLAPQTHPGKTGKKK